MATGSIVISIGAQQSTINLNATQVSLLVAAWPYVFPTDPFTAYTPSTDDLKQQIIRELRAIVRLGQERQAESSITYTDPALT